MLDAVELLPLDDVDASSKLTVTASEPIITASEPAPVTALPQSSPSFEMSAENDSSTPAPTLYHPSMPYHPTMMPTLYIPAPAAFPHPFVHTFYPPVPEYNQPDFVPSNNNHNNVHNIYQQTYYSPPVLYTGS